MLILKFSNSVLTMILQTTEAWKGYQCYRPQRPTTSPRKMRIDFALTTQKSQDTPQGFASTVSPCLLLPPLPPRMHTNYLHFCLILSGSLTVYGISKICLSIILLLPSSFLLPLLMCLPQPHNLVPILTGYIHNG